MLDPLGISEFRWAQLRPGLDMGFSGVHTNLDAVARLGQLYLDDGVWNGRRILPEGWVADASAVHIANPQREEPDWQQGYGFQLWMSRHGYRGDGAFGQYMVVLPEHDAVVAMFSCTEPMQAVLDAMWEHLLPAMESDPTSPTADDAALARRLDSLSLPTVAERCAGGPPAAAGDDVRPGAPGPTSQPTVSSIETTADRIVIHEDDRSIEVPLTSRVDGRRPLAGGERGTARRRPARRRPGVPRHPAPVGDRARPVDAARSSPAGRSSRSSAPDSRTDSRPWVDRLADRRIGLVRRRPDVSGSRSTAGTRSLRCG